MSGDCGADKEPDTSGEPDNAREENDAPAAVEGSEVDEPTWPVEFKKRLTEADVGLGAMVGLGGTSAQEKKKITLVMT